MRISNSYPDPSIGCTLFPEGVGPDELGYGFDTSLEVAPARPYSLPDVKSGLDDPPSIDSVGSGLDTPSPPLELDVNDPGHIHKIRSGL